MKALKEIETAIQAAIDKAQWQVDYHEKELKDAVEARDKILAEFEEVKRRLGITPEIAA